MKTPKKPKFNALPKAPKMTASDATWDNYRKRVDEVKKVNDKKKAEYLKKKSAYEAELKKRQQIKDKAAKVKSSLSGI